MKKIFVINGSASSNSSNQRLIDNLAEISSDFLEVEVFSSLKNLPHFDPELSIENTPQAILDFRQSIHKADGVVICTPEYVFSLPSGVKNAIEWCVSTTIFSDKPLGIITASASGEIGHQELQRIMKTLMAKFTSETTLLIQGIKGKINQQGEITDSKTKEDLLMFIENLKDLICSI